mmetsp:Transcript_43601/g.138825  ORF Transcript_43601/g.138825 Transcript_43601/m.138825 type:complete len:260 (-) Transcript_43601:294-1073(-)
MLPGPEPLDTHAEALLVVQAPASAVLGDMDLQRRSPEVHGLGQRGLDLSHRALHCARQCHVQPAGQHPHSQGTLRSPPGVADVGGHAPPRESLHVPRQQLPEVDDVKILHLLPWHLLVRLHTGGAPGVQRVDADAKVIEEQCRLYPRLQADEEVVVLTKVLVGERVVRGSVLAEDIGKAVSVEPAITISWPHLALQVHRGAMHPTAIDVAKHARPLLEYVPRPESDRRGLLPDHLLQHRGQIAGRIEVVVIKACNPVAT